MSRSLAKKYITAFQNTLVAKSETIELETLNQFLVYFNENERVKNYFISPLVKTEEKIQSIEKISNKINVSERIKSFMTLITMKNRLFLLNDLIKESQDQIFEINQTNNLIIHVPKALSKESETLIVKQFEKITNKKLLPNINIDPTIIAGFKVEIGEKLYDGTLNNTIDAIQRNFSNN